MSFLVGLDVGGSKIAGIAFDKGGNEVARNLQSTPANYSDFIDTCVKLVLDLEKQCGGQASIGIGIPGTVDHAMGTTPYVSNIPYLSGQSLQRDLQNILQRKIYMANDANCAALSEATDGIAADCSIVFGLIMGTGAGGGLVINRRLIEGVHGIAGEIGHLPLPFRSQEDGPVVTCSCGQAGCIDKSISGPALERLYQNVTGHTATPSEISERAARQDSLALQVLDQFYTTVAKAMITVIHTYDPDIIVVSGGLSGLYGLYNHVPQRWGQYSIIKHPKTKLLPAKYGAMTGLRGAAWLGKNLSEY